ncbi:MULTISPECIES: hypothetical protein [Streptomyces]|uniref:Uncharacterized protein n=1 Tax=Streptomyces tsukubensis (strain DSM 42081 / NBRC 108919 / NRRL 18488 / 9993) TaxID=1114943 RepID=I2MXF8_STRT9|nr:MULTISPECIES: hypothetical protein [Streptomyces]AZK93831.1 hypothetical protein B7R87_08015 [Streptomyces tsukubensis]EIF89455.1 hypothetical protein [Streptomyces tsukubensis NRRL18488]MYS65308.1 hypothetical protein [Streptomyces sp. SID5473]QKM70035.1 hypothetical protein STSU_025810 [Streptomyces tsukubensis NRRL18488]TAI45989.1 hypothetical protein EWI31_02360 [Streptomyces tsukubensis]
MRTKLATAGLALALAVSGLALAPAAQAAPAAPLAAPGAKALAPGFYAGGTWQIHQSNGYTVTVNLTQDSSGRLYGSGSSGSTAGTIEYGAVVDGNAISFILRWSNGSRGRYTGNLGLDRRLSGISVDLSRPTNWASWVTTRTF